MRKLSRSFWLVPVIIILLSLTTVGSIALGSGANEDNAFEPFYGVSRELTAKLEQIVLADSRVQELTRDRQHILIVNGHYIKVQDFDIAVGVHLKEEVTPNEFKEWVKSGRNDSSLIEEYVGVINIGYNDRYHILINRERQEITELIQEKGYRNIPELTMAEKETSISMALNDSRLIGLLTGKDYKIAPDGRIGVWHTSYKEDEDITKLGVAFEIRFDKPYEMSYNWPIVIPTNDAALPYQESSYYYSGNIVTLGILVNLDDERVVRIAPTH